MNDQNLLSIVIPVYNVEKYIKQCLNSLVIQDLTEIEIILIDDGSTDSSGKICDEYSKKYSSIKVYHQKNGGRSSARNLGIQVATSTWITFVDSDDLVTNDYIDTLKSILYKSNIDIIIFKYRKFRQNRIKPNINNNLVTLNKISSKEAYMSLGDETFGCYLWNKIYKKKLFKDILFPLGRNFEDMDTLYKVYNSSHEFYVLNKVLYLYRQREDSLVYTITFKNKEDRIQALYDIYKYEEKNYPSLYSNIQSQMIVEGMHYIYDARKQKNRDIKLVTKVNKLLLKSDQSKLQISTRFKLELFMYKHFRLGFNLTRWAIYKLKR